MSDEQYLALADRHQWQHIPVDRLQAQIEAFRDALPGWWFSVGECQVSADASCGPTRESEHIKLISVDRRFDDGFHADLPQPATMADALTDVLRQAKEAIAAAGGAGECDHDWQRIYEHQQAGAVGTVCSKCGVSAAT